MEFFKKQTTFDFLGIKWWCIGASWALIITGLVVMFAKGGYRYGIDFSGGTQLILQFRDPIDINALRADMASLGHGETTIQKFEESTASQQFLIRIQEKREGEDVTALVLDSLSEKLSPGASGGFDLNRKGKKDLADALRAANVDAEGAAKAPDAAAWYEEIAQKVIAHRSEKGSFANAEAAAATPGIPGAVAAWIKTSTTAGPFVVLSAENVGPQVGKDLQRQATYAVLWSLAGMLAYIAFRFDFKFGVGAVIATIHDILITLAFFAFLDKEITLVVIAAFLTLVGYSVNDTVVVYDRIRENLKIGRGKQVEDVINLSINQTLSRTILVSGTTMLAVLALFFWGGEVIHDFAFTLVVGIIIGTYSSIYVAAPVVAVWNELIAKRKAAPEKKK
jgi:preprotein translocase subunit SecF